MLKRSVFIIFEILEKKSKKKLFYMFFLMIVLGILEVIGVAAIGPFIALLLDRDMYQNEKFFVYLNSIISAKNYEDFFIIYAFITFLLILFINFFNVVFQILINRFSNFQAHKSSVNLFRNYLKKPYNFFLNTHPDILSKNILTEVHRGVAGIILPLLNICSKFLILLFMIIFLSFVNFLVIFLSIFILFIFYLTVYGFLKNKLTILGRNNNSAMFSRFKFVNEALKNIKFLKLSGKEYKFIEYFSLPSKVDAKTRTLNIIYSILPRYVVEVISFFLLILFSVILIVSNNSNINSFFPLMGIFGMAIFRMIPCMQGIYSSLTSLRYNMPAFDLIREDLKKHSNKKINDIEILQPFKSIEIKNISYSYAKMKKLFFIESIKIKSKNIIGLCGKSGSGKTTSLDLISGMLNPISGSLIYNEKDITNKNTNYSKLLSYIPQNSFLFQATIAENISFLDLDEIINNKEISKKIEKACASSELTDLININKDGIFTKIGGGERNLSNGQIQRIGIARAIFQDREIIILDESTSSLDPVTEEKIINNVNNLNKTIIIVSHNIALLKKCNYIYFFEDGIIKKEGYPADIKEIFSEINTSDNKK